MGRRNRKRRSSEERQAVRRGRLKHWVLAPVRLLLLAALGVGLGLAAWQVAIYLRTSSALSVRCIEVNGTSRTRSDDLLQAAGLREGVNIFSVDLEAVQRRLVGQPWVHRAEARRVVPDRIVLDIVEHLPAALVNLEGVYLVNPEGEVFKRLRPGETADLPLITGIDRSDVADDPQRVQQSLQSALEMIRQVEQTPCLAGRELAEVHLDEVMGTSLVLDPGALSVRLGLSAPASRLDTLCALFAELDRRELRARAVLLDRPDPSGWATVQLEPARPKEQAIGSDSMERI